MVDVAELRGIIAKKGKSQTEVAKYIGISPKTFYLKMQKQVFGSDEIEKMIDLLDITDTSIFFGH